MKIKETQNSPNPSNKLSKPVGTFQVRMQVIFLVKDDSRLTPFQESFPCYKCSCKSR